ncbi:MAG: hypothetical protein VXX55_03010 [Planctomycetota bacterium]|nr:hypothetical protein [Planctomycetota bacterium]
MRSGGVSWGGRSTPTDSQQRHGGLLIFDLRVIASTMSPSEKASGPNLFDGLANSFLKRYR